VPQVSRRSAQLAAQAGRRGWRYAQEEDLRLAGRWAWPVRFRPSFPLRHPQHPAESPGPDLRRARRSNAGRPGLPGLLDPPLGSCELGNGRAGQPADQMRRVHQRGRAAAGRLGHQQGQRRAPIHVGGPAMGGTTGRRLRRPDPGVRAPGRLGRRVAGVPQPLPGRRRRPPGRRMARRASMPARQRMRSSPATPCTCAGRHILMQFWVQVA
jgi:hypothetical protein